MSGADKSGFGLLYVSMLKDMDEVDAEVGKLVRELRERENQARATAQAHRRRGDLIKWRKCMTVANVYRLVRLRVDAWAAPF